MPFPISVQTLSCSQHLLTFVIFLVSLSSFALKINKGGNFCPEARTVKIAVTLQFVVLVLLYLLS